MKSTAPASNPLYALLRVVEGGHEDHGSVAGLRIGLEAAACLIAVDARHDDIEQDDQGPGARRDPQAPPRHCGPRTSGSSDRRALRAGCPGSWVRHRPGESGPRHPQRMVWVDRSSCPHLRRACDRSSSSRTCLRLIRIVAPASSSCARTIAAPRLWDTGLWRGRESWSQRGEDPRRQDDLEILERGASQVHVAGVERQRRNLYRLALQHEREEIEDVLADDAVIDGAGELAFDGLIDDSRRQRQLGMFVRQGQERPFAAQPNLGLDTTSAWTRPSRARIDAQDFSTKGNRRRTSPASRRRAGRPRAGRRRADRTPTGS